MALSDERRECELMAKDITTCIDGLSESKCLLPERAEKIIDTVGDCLDFENLPPKRRFEICLDALIENIQWFKIAEVRKYLAIGVLREQIEYIRRCLGA